MSKFPYKPMTSLTHTDALTYAHPNRKKSPLTKYTYAHSFEIGYITHMSHGQRKKGREKERRVTHSHVKTPILQNEKN